MTLTKTTVAVTCLLTIFCIPICSQDRKLAKKATPGNLIIPLPGQSVTVCPGAHTTVKIIELCKQSPISIANPQQGRREMELRPLQGNSIWVEEHDDVILHKVEGGEQVAWTCKSQPFQLISIKSIQTKMSVKRQSGPPSNFPFCPKLENLQESKHSTPPPPPAQVFPQGNVFPAGTILYSGPPVGKADGCYKYTFKVGKTVIDPHIIVTDPPPPVYGQRGGDPTPTPTPLPKCDFDHRFRPAITNQ